MKDGQRFQLIADNLSPERPIRSSEFLRGRSKQLEDVIRELTYFQPVVFVFGYRGVGKTSLARTAAQLVTPSDREHVYVACAPGSRILHIFREIGEQLLKLAIKHGSVEEIKKRLELEVSLTPAIRASFESKLPSLEPFEDVNAAVRVLKELDGLIPDAKETVVVIDELEELAECDRPDLAFFVKQVGDQEFLTRYLIVGIAENVHELIGAHESLPRYIKEVALEPLDAQYLIDIVENAASRLGIEVSKSIVYRIAIIGNGFPHFAHLMGKALLTEAILLGQSEVTDDVYRKGVGRAVGDSIQELRIAYETATQRGENYFKHLIWAMAHSDVVDIRIDQWIDLYHSLAKEFNWEVVAENKLKTAIGNFKSKPYAEIVRNTPARYGSTEMRYRYKRFSNTLMRGHVRLQAENEGFRLGGTSL